MRNTPLRGDDVTTRLLSFFQAVLGKQLLSVKPIRSHVWEVTGKHGNKWIAKRFSTQEDYMKQRWVTNALLEKGLSGTNQMISEPDELFFDGKGSIALLEYIPHANVKKGESITYTLQKDRKDAHHLLRSVHELGQSIQEAAPGMLTRPSLLMKWHKRFADFEDAHSVLSTYIPKTTLQKLHQWGQWALDGMNSEQTKDTHTILHGDVAAHNFIRHLNGNLYMIDFDLVAYGPAWYDEVQFANRILPYIHWSSDLLCADHAFQINANFLYGLAFPSDIYREWNRTIRENLFSHKEWMSYVERTTFHQLSRRMNFIEKIRNMVES